MYINNLVSQIGGLFAIILIGVYARKRKIVGDETKRGLTEIIVNITLPCMIIASFNQKLPVEMIRNAGSIVIISFIVHIWSFSLSKILFNKYPDDIKSVLRYSTVFSNAAFMGYPVLEGLYGSIGIFYASMYSVPYRIFMWTLGVALFTKNKKQNYFKEVFLNPGIIAVLIGLILGLTPIEFPKIINETLNIVGSMTTPLSMIMVGATLADVKVKGMFREFPVLYNSIVRLVMLPLLTLMIFKAFGVKDIVLAVIVLLTAMPTGAITAILAGRYDANASFASKCVFTSTILSIITIPLISMLL